MRSLRAQMQKGGNSKSRGIGVMDRPSHCLSAVCNGASLRGLFMPLADSPGLRISPLLHLSPQRAHLPHVPPEPTAYCLLLTIETGDLLDLVKL